MGTRTANSQPTIINPNHHMPPSRPQPPQMSASNSPQMQHRNAPPRPTELPRFQSDVTHPPQQSTNGGLFSSFKGAGSFFKNLKDTSSKVMQTVQQSIARTDLDISCITQRILVMPCPSEGLESTYKTNNIEDVKLFLESRYSLSNLSIYNFGSRSCPRLPPTVRTFESNHMFMTGPAKALSLAGMYSLAADMYGYLAANPKNVLVIQSPDGGRAMAATMVTLLV
jgi:cyclin G-associated kinase